MTLKEYIKELQKIAKKYPDAVVVYSKDEEGNGFNEVFYPPSIGNFSKFNNFCGGDFVCDDGTKEYAEKSKNNAVCLN